ncbi:MAG: tRNA (N6-isopentenyl adenosine(37)-C2)-methylthiotransferase MiaB [Lachnospiraceae bacterium]|jgi:tRNA-2-methylthio-N6-dimethylallyladenosine synthase|nr:tRNA (N6-isopentenyl adenosine(37)-C2)-methylthiotransferase MiaB [Lachnospiraceae bacterium]
MINKFDFDEGKIPSIEPDRQYFFIEEVKKKIKNIESDIGHPLTYCVTTFGCQMNARDSEKLEGILKEVGFVKESEEAADFVIFNTCTVRENANDKLYGRLGRLKSSKKTNPHKMIALCGCMMQEPSVIEKIKQSYHYVDLIFGTHNIYKFAELLYYSLISDRVVIDILKDTDKIVENLPVERKYPFKSGVNIMFGCNNFCSYCIVPYVRGRERSREPEAIIKEIKSLVADGVTEIMLLGQNVNSYGKNLDNPITFAKLLEEVEKVEGLKRIRFMTSHPKDLSDELIEVMSKSKKICKQLHLPVQSGSDNILKKMNRHYSKESYLELVSKLRKKVPDIEFTTDIIVGFPGETEEDFLETLDLIKKVRYISVFTFIYSKRTGTPAATMENQVDEDIIKDRFNRLLKEVSQIGNEETCKYQGKTYEALVEGISEHDPSLASGRLSNNVLVHFKGNSELIGQYVNVSLDECKGFYFMGSLV